MKGEEENEMKNKENITAKGGKHGNEMKREKGGIKGEKI